MAILETFPLSEFDLGEWEVKEGVKIVQENRLD
jgi:hypothetical protein